MKPSRLCIDLVDNFSLEFGLLDSPLVDLWLERMQHRDSYKLDDAKRFYGFGTPEQQHDRAWRDIEACVTAINQYQPIVEQRPRTRDYLNYLHHIFEVYHGTLDQQNTEFWHSAPQAVRVALAQLNIAVHRVESAMVFPGPRFVCTWFGMPKIKTVPPGWIERYGSINPRFGTVCMNFCEIGKTLEDITNDNDNYITDNTFKPFNHYSADFVVRLWRDDDQVIARRIDNMKTYFQRHRAFFAERGYKEFEHEKLIPYRLPVAQLITDLTEAELIAKIEPRQHVEKIYFK